MTTPSAPRILLLGGHGRVSLYLTPLLLSRSHPVTSVIRNPQHASEIEAFNSSASAKAKVDVLVDSLDEVQDEGDAKRVLEKVKPNWVVWAAGAGGKGGAERTEKVDRRAAVAYISAAANTPSITKFLMISYVASRRGYPSWWNAEDRAAADKVNTETLPAYYKAKVAADEHLAAVAKKRGKGFQAINLRPGTLADDEGTGRVWLGKTSSRGKISREDVARVAVELLERDDVQGWWDLLQGEDEIKPAVEKLAKEGWDAMMDGEDLDRIYSVA
ncbi:uncharacterized protein HMPREF1541_11015 [Cyphellophora europaea CBS 101466]|uniref:NAD(P)-binding domain-containing protein n=1 Tax=Cyphellophora europaea (strain CBS 101466) TaxID=1220924 RepID=W2S7L0_CYPE1|nr:uncharacterized protein HMPREF1541_11015 [Cyphellophora europaea CBS 101466]ETN43884.1 hypothetical protein HMPREF1541_11015 [Cyphellophora europaea CBS 101466]